MENSEASLETLDIAQTAPWSVATVGRLQQTFVICPKHGTHEHTIASNIKGHEGTWCMLCALEKLGEPLETEQHPFKWERE